MIEKKKPGISNVHFSALESTRRIDAEYYLPRYLRLDTLLAGPSACYWGDLGGQFIVGPFGSAFTVDNYVDDPVFRYIRGRDVKPFFLLDDDNVYIPEADFFRLQKHQVEVDNLLVSVVGTLGNVAIVTEDVGKAIYSCKSTLYRPSGAADPYYLCAYLNSAVGQAYLERNQRGAIQIGLNLDDLRSIPIYVPPFTEQQAIGDLVRQAYEQRQESKCLYRQAEQLLLDALGLSDLKLPAGLYNDAPISKAWEAHRIDAEYYQPRYECLDQAIRSVSATIKPLSSLIYPIINGFDWRDFVEDGIPYIRVGDVYKDWIDLDNASRVAISPEEVGKPVELRVGDVLFTRKGTFGQAAVVDDRASSTLISSEIMRLRLLDPSAIHPQYLSLYLNSVLGYTQVERRVHGAGFYSISQGDLGQVLICVPGWKAQKKIAGEVTKSHAARHRAESLLEQAKHEVEALIEMR